MPDNRCSTCDLFTTACRCSQLDRCSECNGLIVEGFCDCDDVREDNEDEDEDDDEDDYCDCDDCQAEEEIDDCDCDCCMGICTGKYCDICNPYVSDDVEADICDDPDCDICG